ncbi:hypothetical protein NH286_03295 [Anaerococcus sp. NML200574]|uniref:hypothetical protein n=1 Tax=Anaerococcus sp. NML200574 TaxID=2954486 RepID=UPI0022379B23|nr:hypothetical protein [Anaerococcus sp. NML200574]MCW6678178.1 hypothetical protein [Anaerococcus sp. NML200574]
MSFKFKGLSPAEKMRSRRIYDKEVQKVAASNTSTSLIESFLALVCETLSDEFGWGNVILNRFRERLINKLDCINTDLVDFEDIRANMNIQTIVVQDKKVYKIDDDLRELKKKEIEDMKAKRKHA